ncbi:Hypothetical protein RAK1035_2595 [Roseovarius sp. AK1035]|nr:Hypothetical protein RAK1035_2595 [Roseovarius sp. AK1035]
MIYAGPGITRYRLRHWFDTRLDRQRGPQGAPRPAPRHMKPRLEENPWES